MQGGNEWWLPPRAGGPVRAPVEEVQEGSVQQGLRAGPEEGTLRTEASERRTGVHQVGSVGRTCSQRGPETWETLGAWRNEDWEFTLSNMRPDKERV